MIQHTLWLVRIAYFLLVLRGAIGDEEGQQQELEPRIGNGVDALPTDPGGNVAVRIGIAGVRYCTAAVVNNQWIVTAAHCIDDAVAGGYVSIFYTDTKFGWYHTTTVAEIFINPDYVDFETFVAGSIFGSFTYWEHAAHDFGMVRLRTPLPATCEDGISCNRNNPDIPMNVPMLYGFASPGILQFIADLLSFGLSSGLFGDAGFFNRDQFHLFGYGTVGDKTDDAYRKAVIPNTFSATYNGGQWWASFFRDRLLFNNDGRPCGGDSGAPFLMRGGDGMFAVAGVLSGGTRCDSIAGFKFAYRLDFETADWIQSNVESSGGNCTRDDLNGDQVLQCFNSP